MDMDDPWGSPWADEVNNHDELEIRRIDDVAGGTRVGRASENLRNNVDTTWGTLDDGFGDWNEDTGEKKGGQHSLGLDGAAEQWNTSKRGGNLEVANDDADALSPAWNDFSTSPAREVPKLSPSLLAKPVTIAREPSPDPWANAAPSEQSASVENRVDSQATVSSQESTEGVAEEAIENDSLEGIEVIVPQSESPVVEKTLEQEEPPLDQAIPEIADVQDKTSEEVMEFGFQEESESDPSTEGIEQDHRQDEIVRPSTREPEHELSQLSSSPSEASNHDESPPDSPRTSLDEEPKRSRITRAISPSVQEPIQNFDVLTAPEDELTSEMKHENSEDDKDQEEPRNEEPDDDEFGDFGDFEEGISDDEELVENQSSKYKHQKKPSGPVDFSINPASVKTLFGETGEQSNEAVEKIFIPDTIIADTFASTEERKMWYRISRYGTMRKYNTGDDENYVRIAWASSQVKQDTQKIVARWMEEDRNNGHVSLDGTSKGGSVFGWNDPNAPPVPLATVLGSKRKNLRLEAKVETKKPAEVPKERSKELARDRSRSRSRSSSKQKEHSSTNSIESNHNPLPQPPVAQFGWATTPIVQTASDSDSLTSTIGSFAKPLPLQMNSDSGHSRQSSSALHSPLPMSPIKPPPKFLQAAPKPRPISMPPPSTNSSSSLSIANLTVMTNGLNDDNDDDEWGEMVSSPVVTEAPKFLNRGLRHKKSMSLGNSFTDSVPLPNPQVTNLQFGFGHKSTSSLDNILGKPKSSINSQPPLSPGTTFSSPLSLSPSFGDLWSMPAITPVLMQSNAIPPPSPTPSISGTTNTSSKSVSTLPSHTTIRDIWSQPPPSTPSVLTPPPTSTWSHSPSPSLPPPSASTKDPWASVDFSFFDMPTPAPAHSPTSLSSKATTPRPQSFPAPPKPKTVTFSAPSPKHTTTPLAPAYTIRNSKSKFEMEQDDIVKKIVSGLPDLGYMLKR
ncbi:hypothetical protein DID88_002767 [Monilinia fructigena]|uniref:Uncharacterized protein n=1 Tax=Monilinia fructigena TaxID=38457 RepID=A0A395ITM3_9HELO|nr:hypothetical protein DID88_002767 [Monilinia fructigena]